MNDSPTAVQVFINWLPFLVYLALTLYMTDLFRRYMKSRAAFQKELLEHLRRHTEAIQSLADKRP